MSQKLSNVGYNANITLQMIEATHGGLKVHTSVFVHRCYLYCHIMNRNFRKNIFLLLNRTSNDRLFCHNTMLIS